MIAGGRLNCLFLDVGIRSDGLEGVDWEGIEEFVGYYEGCLVLC